MMHLAAILFVTAVATPGETVSAPDVTRVVSCTTVVQPQADRGDRHPEREVRRIPPPLRRLLRRQHLIEPRGRAAGLEVQDRCITLLARDLARRSTSLLSAARPLVESSRTALRLTLAGATDASLHVPPPAPPG